MPDRVISVPQATQIATRIKNKFDNVNGRLQQQATAIGDLSQLQTDDKTDLVSAINEAAQTGGGTGGDSVPVNVRQAIYDLFSTALYDSDSEKYPNLQSNLTILSTWIEAVTAINLVPRSLMLNAVGLTSQLSATTVPAGGTITWISSDTDVATVSDSGLVTTTGFGSCTITATSGAVSESCSVVVSAKTLVSIDAVYTPSGKVYTTDSLDVLKPKLTVTAHWSDSSTSAVSPNDYVLSGTLTKGTSEITVSYGGKTDTISVTVTGLYTVTNNLTNATTSNNTTTAEDGAAYTATLTAGSGFSTIVTTVTMGGVDITSTAYNNRVISIPNVTGNIEITAYGASAYLYDYPFNGTIAGRGRADLGLHTYTTGTQAKFANDGTYDFLYGTSADDVLVADTPSGFVLDGDFTISIYGAAESAKGNNMLGWNKYLGTDLIPTKYNVVNSQTYSPTSGRRSKVTCGISIFTDGNGLNTNLCNSDLTYGASINGAPAKAECWDDAWHHYCLQRDNGVITMYFDKTPVWTIETNDTLYLGDKLAIGGVWSFNADDGTFRAYNTSQVPTHYHARIRNLVIDDSAIDISTL